MKTELYYSDKICFRDYLLHKTVNQPGELLINYYL